MDELLERGADIDARTKGACGCKINKTFSFSTLLEIYFMETKQQLNLCNRDSTSALHTAAKERNRRAIRFLIKNGAFLPDNIEDTRFNPPAHYCPGLEWAYEEMKRVQQESSSSSGEGSYSS